MLVVKISSFSHFVCCQATDDDEPNTPNSEVSFRIIKASAGLRSKFSVNETSGEVMLKDVIDFEKLPSSLGGKILLEVEAYDHGEPSLSSSMNITVEIEVSENYEVGSFCL